jgi:hypothetical protein
MIRNSQRMISMAIDPGVFFLAGPTSPHALQ